VSANLATVLGVYVYSPAAALGAGAAALGAGRPGSEASEYAVNRACIVVALPRFTERWADVAAVGCVGENRTGAALGASATSERAGGPGSPCGNFAMDGARTFRAGLSLGQGGASHAAVYWAVRDGPGAGLEAAAAGL
jgi:hypothetical protein